MASERSQLEYLGRSKVPLWGGHLKRGEPLADADIQRWLDNGLVEVAPERDGYQLTEFGRMWICSYPRDIIAKATGG